MNAGRITELLLEEGPGPLGIEVAIGSEPRGPAAPFRG